LTKLLSLALILSILHPVISQTLEPCQISAPDQVTQLLPNFTGTAQPCSYSGFAPLDSEANSALYYWYFPARNKNPKAPLLVWLQGGPGASSMFGCLVEKLSPLSLVANPDGGFSIIDNDVDGSHSWASEYNTLFIDNPVGTGFSYTTNNAYPTTEDALSDALWTALQYFVSVHPETLKIDWYFTGESYSGRYVPAFAYYTLKYNGEIDAGTRNQTKIPLKSILVGDGYVHGVQQRFTEIDVAISAAMLAPYQIPQAKALSVNCQNLAATQGISSDQAVTMCNKIPDYMASVSGIDAYAIQYNANRTSAIDSLVDGGYLNHPEVYNALRVTTSKKQGPLFTDGDENGAKALNHDILNNSLGFINDVLHQIPCLYFAGNFDARDGSYGYFLWLELLGQPFSNILGQTRNIWYVDGMPVGFWMEYGNLTFITITNAGHFVPYFQIDVSRKMVDIWTTNKNWDPYRNTTNVSTAMCNYMNNCNGNGKCSAAGTCICNPGYFLEDCSLQPQAYNPSANTYTLPPRGYVYLKFTLGTQSGASISIQGNDASKLDAFYSFDKVATYIQDADGVLSSGQNTMQIRKIFLSAGSAGKNTIYLTVQNTDFLSSVSFTLQSNTQSQKEKEKEEESQKELIPSLTIFAASMVFLIASVFIVRRKN